MVGSLGRDFLHPADSGQGLFDGSLLRVNVSLSGADGSMSGNPGECPGVYMRRKPSQKRMSQAIWLEPSHIGAFKGRCVPLLVRMLFHVTAS